MARTALRVLLGRRARWFVGCGTFRQGASTLGLIALGLSLGLSGCKSAPKKAEPPNKPSTSASAPVRGPKKTVTLGAYEFDPAVGLPKLPDGLGPVAKDPHFVVQFFDPPSRDLKARLSKLGLRLTEYVPRHAYIETLSDKTLAELRALPSVRAIVPYAPAFKVSPRIGKQKFRTPERIAKAGIWLNVVLHRGENPTAVAQEARALGALEIEVKDKRGPGAALLRLVLTSAAEIPKIARLAGVLSLEEVAEQSDDNGTTAGTIQSGTPGTTPLWGQNLHGEGQIVSVNDSGPVDINHCMFQDPANATAGPAHRKMIDVRATGGDGTHATFVAGILAGDDFNNLATGANRGNAWAARIVSASRSADDMLTMLNLNRDAGATIHSNSWHDDTGNPSAYNQTASDVDAFTWNNEDHVVVGSMGNVGEEQGPPGIAKNAIGVQASQRDPNEGNFGDGNAGPTADGRRKPDVTAPGCTITSAQVGTACTITTGEIIYGVPPAQQPQCATSWATPATSAAATLLRQYFREGFYPTGTREPHNAFLPSGALVKATLLNATIDMAGPAGYPNTTEGWGMLRLDDAAFFPGGARNLRVWDFRNGTGIAGGETREYQVQVASAGEPLKVTLVWTDPPPASSAWANPTVNDLDLTVISPGGASTFLGNVFAAGQSTTGGATDTINNVEQVLVNAPVVGAWTLRVTGTAVNVGNPFQGFALVATADLPEPAPPSGAQDTLVVRVTFPDPDLAGVEPPLPSIQNTMIDVATYLDAVSFANASVTPAYHPNVVPLDRPSDQYFPPHANPLIEMTEEVLGKLLEADAAVLTRDPATAGDDIDRVILVTNDPDFNDDWATTGSWPFDVPGLGAPISVSIQSFDNDVARFSHGLLHQLNLVDLYAHEGVVFAFPHANGWDIMAKPFSGQHPLLWSKQRASWLTDGNPDVHWIPRPAAGTSYAGINPIGIHNQSEASGVRKGIVIGLSEGSPTPASENVFYYVEARTTADPHDANLPGSGVLVYYVNENVAQGEGPVWLLDAEPGTSTLGDAAFQVGDSRTIPGTGITIDVLAGSGGSDFDIQLAYAPPNTDNDVGIVMGETIDGEYRSYMSPDIWVDNGRNGFDEDGGGAPNPGNADQPIEGEVNRLYFRLRNPGPGDAFDVNVHVRMSEPYHTIGDEADFNRFVGQVHLPTMAAGAPDAIRFVEWVPDTDDHPHSCAWVETLSVFNDVNTFNNAAQENLREVTSTTASPYTEVTYPVSFSNPYSEPHLFYFRPSGIPADWSRDITPVKAFLAPGERVGVTLKVKPPDHAPVCSNHLIEVTSWASRGDTLVQVGAAASQVGLRQATEIDTKLEQRPCGRPGADGKALQPAGAIPRDNAAVRLSAVSQAANPERLSNCMRLVQIGCTDPPRPFEEIILRYEDPSGNPVYHTVTTDENGCFEDFYVAVEGGVWSATAEYPGGDCSGPRISGVNQTTVQVASDGDQDDDGRPDRNEHPADADNDGLTGPVDPDSDNDGVGDGDEPEGDFDGDGFVNVIDPDADGDGIQDGKDATPWGDGYRPPDKRSCSSWCDCRIWIAFGVVLLVLLFGIWWALWRRR